MSSDSAWFLVVGNWACVTRTSHGMPNVYDLWAGHGPMSPVTAWSLLLAFSRVHVGFRRRTGSSPRA